MEQTLNQVADNIVEHHVLLNVSGFIDELQRAHSEHGSYFEWGSELAYCEPTDEQIKEYIEDNTTDQYQPDEDDARSELQLVEVLEYWAVDEWLANKLRDRGEAVSELGGYNIWGRQTSGQAIAIDYVIESIAKDISEAREFK